MNNKDLENTSNNKARNNINKLIQYLPWSKLNKEQEAFYKSIFEHKEQQSPQAVQGMWQAYGQMRAAKIIGTATVFSVGFAGVILRFYHQFLSRHENELLDKKNKILQQEKELKKQKDENLLQAKELEKQKNENLLQAKELEKQKNENAQHKEENLRKDDEILKQKEQITEDIMTIERFYFSYQTILEQLKNADDKIKDLCGENRACFDEYALSKNKIEEKTFEEKNTKLFIDFFSEQNIDLKNNGRNKTDVKNLTKGL